MDMTVFLSIYACQMHIKLRPRGDATSVCVVCVGSGVHDATCILACLPGQCLGHGGNVSRASVKMGSNRGIGVPFRVKVTVHMEVAVEYLFVSRKCHPLFLFFLFVSQLLLGTRT